MIVVKHTALPSRRTRNEEKGEFKKKGNSVRGLFKNVLSVTLENVIT